MGNIALVIAALNLSVLTFAFHSPVSVHSKKGSLHQRHEVISAHKNFPSKSFNLFQASNDEDPFNLEETRQESYIPTASQPQRQTLDPLVASLTRVDEMPSRNTPTANVPLLGEIPADGNLALLAPAAAIAVLGFIFSIVVAFNARDAIVQELSQVQLPKMEYTPAVVEEGVCRGLCSSQENDLEGLRGFMEGLAK
jgi:hypothetical protein